LVEGDQDIDYRLLLGERESTVGIAKGLKGFRGFKGFRDFRGL
jgi:hypothetical protein